MYDEKSPGKTFQTFNNEQQMDQYFSKIDPRYKRYRYVISESHYLAETKSLFFIRNHREHLGLSIID